MTAANLRKMIHTGCRQCGIDNDARRDLQLLTTGKASMSDMSEADLLKMVEALKQRGFNASGNTYYSARKGTFKGRANVQAGRADVRFIHVLWGQLGKAGKLNSPDRAGLNAFIRSRFASKWDAIPLDVDALQDAGQINAVIRALKDMCKREGIALK
ncbi:regulatory protein GemA [Pseudomonas sp. GX19020]|uniref:regulatory protein GemA n=1 Tax=Pseudomonas sp. GX19020 TaxID=2942277 RepID=UPI002019AD22|nr:regulatory protein GemA [Pseudomonas sp. GX19020]MCL4065905.1 regulatory protein GemA [Pseudomonas sp. GX19020]